MLNIRQFYELSPLPKLFILLVMILAALLFSSLFGILLLYLVWGPESLSAIADPALYSDPTVTAQLKLVQIINQVLGLLLPAIIFMLFTDRNLRQYVSCRTQRLPVAIAITVLFMLAAQPFIGWLGDLNARMELPGYFARLENWFRESEARNTQLTDAFLATTSLKGFAVNMLMIAVLPALAEEAVFRGALQPVLGRLFRNKHVGVVVAAAVFAGIHLQFYGFLPRFALGLALGYLFLWSSNLWVPVTAHFINNLLSVIIEFLYRRGYIHTNAADFGNTGNFYLIVASVFISALLLTWFFRKRVELT